MMYEVDDRRGDGLAPFGFRCSCHGKFMPIEIRGLQPESFCYLTHSLLTAPGGGGNTVCQRRRLRLM